MDINTEIHDILGRVWHREMSADEGADEIETVLDRLRPSGSGEAVGEVVDGGRQQVRWFRKPLVGEKLYVRNADTEALENDLYETQKELSRYENELEEYQGFFAGEDSGPVSKQQARNVIQSFLDRTHPSASVADGWKLVPITPSDEMCTAAMQAEIKSNAECGEPAPFSDIWDSMISAAPATPDDD